MHHTAVEFPARNFFCDGDARVPLLALSRSPVDPVFEVIEALGPLAQPQLLDTQRQSVTLVSRHQSNPEVETGAA